MTARIADLRLTTVFCPRCFTVGNLIDHEYKIYCTTQDCDYIFEPCIVAIDFTEVLLDFYYFLQDECAPCKYCNGGELRQDCTHCNGSGRFYEAAQKWEES